MRPKPAPAPRPFSPLLPGHAARGPIVLAAPRGHVTSHVGRRHKGISLGISRAGRAPARSFPLPGPGPAPILTSRAGTPALRLLPRSCPVSSAVGFEGAAGQLCSPMGAPPLAVRMTVTLRPQVHLDPQSPARGPAPWLSASVATTPFPNIEAGAAQRST